jgi:origin recognition complex subunit 5
MENFAKPRCEHVSLLAVVLGDIMAKAGCGKFVLVLDGVDAQREAGQTLLASLARLGDIVCGFRRLYFD